MLLTVFWGPAQPWEDGRGVVLLPAPANFREYGIAILRHLCDDLTGRAGFLMICAPDQNFQKDRGEIDAFLREPVEPAAGVFRVGLGGEDACVLQFAQAIRKDVGGDAFATLLKVFETAEASDHEVADDEQGPAVSKDFKRDADWATGATQAAGLLWHGENDRTSYLRFASEKVGNFRR